LALAYEWTGSLWAAISIHFFFNGATVAMQLALRAGLFPEIPAS
jgi:membrane protease YdiL (CAAX protease family)